MCPYKKWYWHDGGSYYACKGGKNDRYDCEDSYNEHFKCEWILKQEKKSERG